MNDKLPNPANSFSGPSQAGEIRRRSLRGASTTAINQVAKFALQLISTGILARLLSPSEFGLVAMTSVITGFVGIFKEAGLSSATVQSHRLTHEQVSTLFWINGALGASITTILMLGSPVVGWIYDDPRLAGITCGLAVSFLIGGFGVQHQALLRREMRFTALAVLDTLTMVAGTAVAIAMAWSGFGYWSIVWSTVATTGLYTIGVWLASGWKPGPPRRRSGVRPMIRFGGDILWFNLANFVAQRADTFLIGWHFGPLAVGLYDKAYRLLLMPVKQINMPIGTVVAPALARLASQPEDFARFYRNALEAIAGTTIPIVVGLAIFADEVVLLWLGPDWAECATLFRLLAPAACMGAIGSATGWLMISLGHTRKYKHAGIWASAACILAFIIGLPFGPRGVAAAFSITTVLYAIPLWIYVVRNTPVHPADIKRSITPAFTSAAIAGAVVIGLIHVNLPFGSKWQSSAVALLVFALVYTLTLLAGFKRWSLLKSMVIEMRRRPAPGASRP